MLAWLLLHACGIDSASDLPPEEDATGNLSGTQTSSTTTEDIQESSAASDTSTSDEGLDNDATTDDTSTGTFEDPLADCEPPPQEGHLSLIFDDIQEDEWFYEVNDEFDLPCILSGLSTPSDQELRFDLSCEVEGGMSVDHSIRLSASPEVRHSFVPEMALKLRFRVDSPFWTDISFSLRTIEGELLLSYVDASGYPSNNGMLSPFSVLQRDTCPWPCEGDPECCEEYPSLCWCADEYCCPEGSSRMALGFYLDDSSIEVFDHTRVDFEGYDIRVQKVPSSSSYLVIPIPPICGIIF